MIKTPYIKKIRNLPYYYNSKFPILVELNDETIKFLKNIHKMEKKILDKHRKIVKELKDTYLIWEHENQESEIIKESIDNFSRSLLNKTFLKSLELVVTSGCNFSCPYCMRKNITESNPPHMSWKTAKKYVDMLINQDTNGKKLSLGFNGGEPLLNFKLIRQVVNYIKEKGIRVDYNIVTNGSLFSPEVADFFGINNFSLQLSIDGLASNITRYSKFGEDSFKKIEASIRLANMKKIKITGIVTTLTKENWKGVNKNFLKYLKELGINYLSINPDVLASLPFPVKTTANKIVSLINAGDELGISVGANSALPASNILSSMDEYLREYRPICGARDFSSISVIPDGKAYNCSYYQNYLSNYNTIKEYFQDPRNEEFLNSYYPLTSEFCEGCELQGACTTCPAVWEKLKLQNREYVVREECSLKKEIFHRLVRHKLSNLYLKVC